MEHLNRLNRLDPYYHNFADKNKYTDILTNLPIFIAGYLLLGKITAIAVNNNTRKYFPVLC